jgi:hypothetical protein
MTKEEASKLRTYDVLLWHKLETPFKRVLVTGKGSAGCTIMRHHCDAGIKLRFDEMEHFTFVRHRRDIAAHSKRDIPSPVIFPRPQWRDESLAVNEDVVNMRQFCRLAIAPRIRRERRLRFFLLVALIVLLAFLVAVWPK